MLKSITENERIVEIDIIRGIAILGIFFVNFPEMVVRPFEKLSYTGLDGIIRLIYNLLIQTKFYTIFSFLFGVGFYIFMSRAEARGDKMYYLFLRRLLSLFVFGVLHFILLWHGDILNMYSLIGIGLLLFYNRDPKTIVTWAVMLFSLSTILIGFMFYGPILKEFSGSSIPHTQLSYYNPMNNWGSKVIYRFYLFQEISILNAIFYIPEILSLFLFGLYTGKIRFFNRLKEFTSVLKRAQFISIVLSVMCFIPMIILYFNTRVYQQESAYLFIWLSGKTMAVFYISTILLFLGKKKWQTRLKPFSYVGKMALTNYIGQTVVTTIVFSILFKNTATIPLWISIIYCPLFYMVQIKFSKWWLSKYRMGLLEGVWRYATYFTRATNIKEVNNDK